MTGLLSTKLQIPSSRTDPVIRSRLLEKIEAGRADGRRVTLVSAPPGFGKTMLLRQWTTVLNGVKAAWLSLDEHIHDAPTFLDYLGAALGSDSSGDQVGGSPTARLTGVINGVAESGAAVLLVLDDYHALRDFSIHEMTARLIEQGPACLHVAFGTREDPPLPLARLRARDGLTEIRARELRFSADEAQEFFRRTMALDLLREDVELLTARAEGWITGLQLAGIALRTALGQESRDANSRRFVQAFSGDDRFIVDYLLAEVLDRVPAELREFLRRTSVLDRMTAGLCDAVAGTSNSQRILDRLETGNLFLIPLDHRRDWYRYHGLFSQVLRLSLSRTERCDANHRAAAWFRANGYPEDASRHERSAAAERGEGGKEYDALIEPLSAREVEILKLVEEGLSNQEIGERLVIAHSTVKRHVSNIFAKLQVGCRTQAVSAGRRMGLI